MDGRFDEVFVQNSLLLDFSSSELGRDDSPVIFWAAPSDASFKWPGKNTPTRPKPQACEAREPWMESM